MYEPQPQHFLDLQQENDLVFGSGGGDPNSWLSGEDHRPSFLTHRRTLSSFSNATTTTATASGNVDRALFNDLVQMVPLVQSLINQKANTSFTRRGSMIYTKTPSRESLSKKTTELKGRNGAQSIPTKKHSDQDGGAGDFSMFSSSALLTEKDREELVTLREQVEDLQRKLLEKDEILKSAEVSKNEMISLYMKLDEFKNLAPEKDSLLKSTRIQLSDAKIKLADKQAALEKLQWETVTSNSKVVKLQEDLNTMQAEISSFMLLFEGLSQDSYTISNEEYDVTSYAACLPDIDDLDESEMLKMEEAREAYIAAVAAAKEKQDEESIALAASARLHLQSFVLRPN